MSVISTYTARVTISVFITIIALLPNTSNGQSPDTNFYYLTKNRMARFISSESDSSRYEGDSSSSISPKDHVPDIGDTSQSDAKEIPLDFFEQLNNVTDMEDFMQKFIAKDDEGLLRSYAMERSAVQYPKVASCEPTMQVVPLNPYGSPITDPEIYYYPKCTRIKQCSGCCNTHQLECTPIQTQEHSFVALKLKYEGINGSRVIGKEPIAIEEHIKCECQCRVKKEHCNAYQIYDSGACTCNCNNKDEKDKCQSEKGKIWDHTNCTCGCRNEVPCTTGSFFDKKTCKCEEIRVGNSRK